MGDTIRFDNPVAVAVVTAIRAGDIEDIERLLRENPGLATSKIVAANGGLRSLLMVAADWPGHFQNGAKTVAVLIAAGAQPNPPVVGKPGETALHWAASSDDVAVLDALLDGGADIEAPGEGFTGGTPMANAVIYSNWNAARRLVERGAQTTIWQAAALDMLHHVEEFCTADPPPSADEVTNALWHACNGGQRQAAEFLLGRGADINWVGYNNHTPLQAAQGSGNDDLCEWLIGVGAKTSSELK